MKCRWRILKYGIRFHDISKCDQTWMTCCALHNYLLEKDGLAEGWGKSLSPDEDDVKSISMLFALHKLLDINLAQRYDTSGSGIGNDVEIDSGDAQSIAECNAQPLQNKPIQNDDLSYNVNDMSLIQFREKLIRHFNIAFKQHKLKWPRRK